MDTSRLDPACRGLIGIIPSQNTPFNADGRIDVFAVRKLARRSCDAGVAAFLILAVASENRALTIDERRIIAEAFAEEVAGKIPLIVAVSAPDIDTAVTLTRQAVSINAGAVCYQAPQGISREDLSEQIARICDLGPPLFMLQDLDFAGDGLSVADIVWLFERHPRFRAIKVETTGAGVKYTELLRIFDGALHVSGGWAVMQMIEALQRGVHAFMPTGMEHIYCAVHRHFLSGDTAAAIALFEQMLPFVTFSNQHLDASIRFFKHLRLLDGTFATNACRAPTAELDSFQQATLERLAKRAVALDQALAGIP